MVVGFENSKSKELPAETKKLDRKIFDGDMGWALDKAAFHLGISKSDPSGASPYYGLSFEQHLNTFRWIRDRFPTDEKRSEA